MKKKLLLALILTTSMLFSQQVVFIPNGGFNTDISGWSITGTDSSISYGNPNGTDGRLITGVSSGYTENFVLTSPQFYLHAGKTYKLYISYRHVQYDPNTGMESPLGGFDEIRLKDNLGNSVATVSTTSCNGGSASSGYNENCWSANFEVSTSGTFSLDFLGQHSNDAPYELDNVGFEGGVLNTFSGAVSLDVNNDGCATSSVPVQNFPIVVTETTSNTLFYANTDVNGDFTIGNSLTGSFVTQINQPLYTSYPANYNSTIASGVNDITNQNFCIVANNTGNDVNIIIVPTSEARPGFNSSYRLYYANLGTADISGDFSLNFDSTLINFSNASTVPDTTTSNSLSWNYANLAPLETRYVDVNFTINTPPTVNNGDVLHFSTSITPLTGDITPTNNSFVLNQITIGSYDPNDIAILQGAEITPAQALEEVYFRIRFQNTGTASAININVKTVLDSDIDITTFTPLYGSHTFTTSINGSEVNFNFNSINLADSTSDEPNSHGFVVFKAKLITSFAEGDIVESFANIYFDYNLPIITNTATTQINSSLGTEENVKIYFNVFPNPVKKTLFVKSNQSSNYTLFSVLGKKYLQALYNQDKILLM